MELKQLRVFLHVADTGSLSTAAKRLNITQPALSRHIRLLEEEAGTALFIRTGRGVQLTAAGQFLLPRVRLLSDEVERLKMDMRAFAGTVSGEVRLGLPPSVGIFLAAPLVDVFRQNYPHVKLRVTQLLSGALEDHLLNGRLDLGILFEGQTSSFLHTEALWSEELFFITRPDEKWLGQAEISFSDCLNEPLILPGTQHGLRALLEKKARQIGSELNVIIEADSLSIQTELVCRGLGSTVLSYEACRAQIKDKRLIALPLKNPSLQRTSVLVWSHDFPLTLAAQAMADTIKQTASSIFDQLPPKT